MTPWRIRDFHEDDLDAAVRLWDDPAAGSAAPVFGVSDLIAAVRAGAPAVLAAVGDEVVGTVVATVSGARALVLRISLAPGWRRRGIGSAMLTELERRLVAAGAHRVSCLLAGEGEMGAAALQHCGYTVRGGMSLYEKLEPVGPADVGILGQLGGRIIRPGTWDQLGGMAREKELIERRVILPLANSQLAGRLGLDPPRAVILFGPPGTGKTTFAKGAALLVFLAAAGCRGETAGLIGLRERGGQHERSSGHGGIGSRRSAADGCAGQRGPRRRHRCDAAVEG
jgi:transitional endoplasmic reticulum ATPase